MDNHYPTTQFFTQLKRSGKAPMSQLLHLTIHATRKKLSKGTVQRKSPPEILQQFLILLNNLARIIIQVIGKDDQSKLGRKRDPL